MQKFLNIIVQPRLAKIYGLWWGWGTELDVDLSQVKRAISSGCGRLNNGPKDTQTLIPGTLMLPIWQM